MGTSTQLSIIIPVYNVAPYLQKCLDSIYNQTNCSTEVILVNDGSTDDSKDICEHYCYHFSNTKLINKKNGGLSDARNAGTEIAKGDFVYYLDSDDWLAPKAIQTLYDFAIQNDCEVVQGGFYYAYDDHLLYDNKYTHSFVMDRHKAMQELIKNDYVKNFAWGKLYRSDIVKKYQFPKGKYYEDVYWQHLIIHETKRYGVVPVPLYYYRQRSTGISGEFSIRNLDLLEGYENRLSFIKACYPEDIKLMSSQLWKKAYSMLSIAKRNGDAEIKRVFQDYWVELNNNYHDLFEQALASSDLEYIIAHNYSFLIPIYSIYKRIMGRVFPSNRFQIIKKDDKL